jgi:hypothetical protein
MKLSCVIAVVGGLLGLAGCGGGRTAQPRVSGRARPVQAIAAGTPVPRLPVDVVGIPGTAELSVRDPANPSSQSVLVTLGRTVPREPRDVCFGTYAAGESPANGDVFCQVRGTEPFLLTLADYSSPSSTRRFTAVWGQARSGVSSVAVIGPRARSVRLPLSSHRLFLAAFSASARGAFRLVARLADGTSFAHAFTLPLTRRAAGAWPRLRRRGAVSNAGIGENIATRSYRQIIRQFGPPLTTYRRPHGVRCAYYDVVGYERGWSFCFRGLAMVAAAGNAPAPAGVH